ncbi:hypothetical protein LZ32DRAFT_44359 [Colletotrichum eremochloae]|nr:hypothetical protein LZ32DRAFT_44359 [Colletotrichum eremochloae]
MEHKNTHLQRAPNDNNSYRFGRIGLLNVAMCPTSGTGAVNSTLAAVNMTRSFPSIKLLHFILQPKASYSLICLCRINTYQDCTARSTNRSVRAVCTQRKRYFNPTIHSLESPVHIAAINTVLASIKSIPSFLVL